MSEYAPRSIRGSYAKRLPMRQKTTEGLRACKLCGTVLSRWNDGALCNQCHDRVGEARPLRVRGRATLSDTDEE
jgi:hypothetical protein